MLLADRRDGPCARFCVDARVGDYLLSAPGPANWMGAALGDGVANEVDDQVDDEKVEKFGHVVFRFLLLNSCGFLLC